MGYCVFEKIIQRLYVIYLNKIILKLLKNLGSIVNETTPVITYVLLIISGAGYGRTETVADTTRTRNTIHLDGASLFYIGMYSLNYEKTIFRTKGYNLSINAGFGGWYFIPISQSYYGYSIPLSFNNLIGSGNNYFEIDIGLRYIFFNDISSNNRSPYFPVFNLGTGTKDRMAKG